MQRFVDYQNERDFQQEMILQLGDSPAIKQISYLRESNIRYSFYVSKFVSTEAYISIPHIGEEIGVQDFVDSLNERDLHKKEHFKKARDCIFRNCLFFPGKIRIVICCIVTVTMYVVAVTSNSVGSFRFVPERKIRLFNSFDS